MQSTPFKIQIDDGSHRQSDWLELFFDLAFVICIAHLSHELAHHPTNHSILAYIGTFIPVWWIWNQYTWYSAHFNNGDRLFRLFMFSGIAGSLLLAAGLKSTSTAFVFAYLVLHAILFAGWIRAYRHISLYRPYIRWKLTGIACGLFFWSLSLLFDGQVQLAFWFLGTALQLAMPIFAWATVKDMITVHLRHLTERHGLFTIIILGECLVSLVAASSGTATPFDWLYLAGKFALVVFLWWIYFEWDAHAVEMQGIARAFTYNYGHFALYGSLGIVAAGLVQPTLTLSFSGVAAFLASLAAMEWITKRR